MDELPVYNGPCDERGVSEELLDDTSDVRQMESDELFWYDAHFGETEPSERMFKSLQLGGSRPAYDCFESLQHHSLDDMSTHCHQRGAKGLTANGNSDSRDDDDDDDDIDIETMKNKFLSAWTNAKNGWIVRTQTSFHRESPIWLLGNMYRLAKSESNVKKKDRNSVPTSFDDFKLDFKSRIWFTYRTDLPTLPDSRLKSDVGWGCMLRCGQMLLGQAFLVRYLHREWRWNTADNGMLHRQIISYFGDSASPQSPFSIQKLISVGRESGRKAGDWYGPASIANALWSALKQHQEENPESPLTEFSIYIARDGVVYTQDLLDECQSTSSVDHHTSDQSSSSCASCWRSVVIIVPVRLGGEVVNPMYIPCLKALLNNERCIGLIGGKPKHSLYFVGWQDEKLIYLDPHCCQDFVDVQQPDFPLQTFHCMFPRKLSFSKMDPSCAIGFYCQTRRELDELLLELPKVVCPPLQKHYAVFHIDSGRHADSELCFDDAVPEQVVRMSVENKKRHSSADEFTLL